MKKILYFTATWCGPCSYIKPQLQEAANQISISFVDVDSSKDTVAKYNVKNIPCAVLIDGNGTELGRIVGSNVTKHAVIELYNK